jgi:glycosyl transferase family 87
LGSTESSAEGPCKNADTGLRNQTPEFLDPRSSSLRTVLVLSCLLLVYSVWSGWADATQTRTVDFLTFWSVPQALNRQSIPNIYTLEGQRTLASATVNLARSSSASDLQRRTTAAVLELYNGRIDTTASPLLYSLIGVLSSGNYLTDQKRFLFACMSAFVLSILVLARLLKFSLLETVLFLLFLFWNYEPFLSDIRVGNVNELQLFALVLFIFFMARSRPFSAGFIVGASTTFKPTALLVLVLAFIASVADKDFRSVLRLFLGSFVAAVSLVALSAVYFGNSAMWLDFLHSLPNTLQGSHYSLESGNLSLAALLFGAATSRAVIVPIVLVSVLCWLLFSTTGHVNQGRADRFRLHTAFCVAGCGSAITLLSSPLVWLHYYLLLLPLLLYVARHTPDSQLFSNSKYAWLPHAGLFLPYVPLLFFSLLFHLLLGNNVKLLCLFIILATVMTTMLAAYKVWRIRRGINLRDSTIIDYMPL